MCVFFVILFVNNDTGTCHLNGTDMFVDMNTYFWEINCYEF